MDTERKFEKMSDYERKLSELNDTLNFVNDNICSFTKLSNDIKDKIKALERSNLPKPGDIYINKLTRVKYIVACLGANYCLINLTSGNRYSEYSPSVFGVFGKDEHNFIKSTL